MHLGALLAVGGAIFLAFVYDGRERDLGPLARIVAIVDVYDALVHKRVYKPAIPEGEVLRIMKDQAGSHFDNELMDTFLSILPEIRRIRLSVQEATTTPWNPAQGLGTYR